MGGELRDKVASGVAWSLGEKLGTILLQMVVSIVVARLLMPDDVGLMALMTFFSSLALVVVDSGFSQMLIRKGDPAQGDYKSVFLFNVVVSWIVYGVLVAVFPAVAAFYGRPILARIAPVLFLLVPVNALGTIQNTIFMRQFRFALLSKITFVASLASGVLAVTMALAGCGVWSLVGQRLSSIAVRAALLWFSAIGGRAARSGLRRARCVKWLLTACGSWSPTSSRRSIPVWRNSSSARSTRPICSAISIRRRSSKSCPSRRLCSRCRTSPSPLFPNWRPRLANSPKATGRW